jgi:hypothetical protein
MSWNVPPLLFRRQSGSARRKIRVNHLAIRTLIIRAGDAAANTITLPTTEHHDYADEQTAS